MPREKRDERMALYREAVEACPDNFTAWTRIGRIAMAQKELDRPIPQARELFERQSPEALQVYLLAETLGKNRKGVLQGFPAVSATLRAQYEQESSPESPSGDSKE